ncbi:MAG: hypothetical protein AWT59_0140 [Candidatus Gallionella acididurans]|uniref:Uncharacterized protein n=1 Tax=Candidatus Gallionella acididurans TaxID=1796491 RepID=A0A139BXP9_9PROT|nr:MAG: hypothetical protein AWT59_0140 [Candidatus Gallionella acididurans]
MNNLLQTLNNGLMSGGVRQLESGELIGVRGLATATGNRS